MHIAVSGTRREAYDDHAVQLVLALHEPGQDANEVTADSAADATVVHLEDFFFRVKLLLDKRVIDANLSELRRGEQGQAQSAASSARQAIARGSGADLVLDHCDLLAVLLK